MTQTQVKIPWPGWTIAKHLGGGSFGTVYEIQRKHSGSNHTERAALKVIPVPKDPEEIRGMMQNGYSVERLADSYRTDMEHITREYELMDKLKGNANVVYCDDLYCQQSEDGIGWTIYIKMELLKPLSETLENPISQQQTVKLGMDLCKALAECEEHGILHRDIKPGNIMVAKDGNYKLGDFGVAKTTGRTSRGTKTGTYGYMAPEVYNNKCYGTLVDIYSLGMVMYWMLNERCGPFLPLPPTVPSALEMEDAKQRRFDGEPLPAPAHGSEELKQIVLKACAFDPAQRYQTSEELYKDLEQVQMSLSVSTWQRRKARKTVPLLNLKEEPSVGGNSWEQESEITEVADVLEDVLDLEVTVAPDREETEQEVKVKSKVIALLLAIFPYTGLFGFHDRYLGNAWKATIKLWTLNFLVFGWLYDIIMLSIGKYKLEDGIVLK